MQLSLAMIVKNEVAHLGHCLDSVRGLVDEMVVVDTGSSDGTQALARDRGARVVSFPWIEDFSAARNASLAEVKGDWVLVLDADEAIDPVDFPLIRQACGQDQLAGFLMLIRNYLPDGNRLAMDQAAKPNPGGYTEGAGFAHCGDSRALRLFRRLPGMAYQGRLHELMEPFFLERELPMANLDAVIHHFGQTLAARVEAKKPVYLELARRDAEERPEVLESHYHLVLQAMAAEDWNAALAAVAALRARFQPEPSAVTFTQALALQFLDRHPEALAEYDRLLAVEPQHTSGRIRRAVSLAALGRTEAARAEWQALATANPELAAPVIHLAELELAAGDFGSARTRLLQTAARIPRDPALWNRLVQLDVEAGHPELAVQDAWAALQRCPGGGAGTWHQLVALALFQQGAETPGRAVLDLGLRAFPDHPGLTRILEGL